ncbi:MAG TPA: threonine/serine dehydratase [Vicinamibacterales bacterium]
MPHASIASRAVSRSAIDAVHRLIRPHVRETPTIRVEGADLGAPPGVLSAKLELLQHAGAFKARGAFANLLARRIPPAGVVAASGGNHGAAVAFAAMRLGIRAAIFVPSICSPSKTARIRSCGADLHVAGDCYADALAASESYAAETGALPIHAFDQIETLLGQGTVGLELASQAPDLDTVIVPIGGGGLIGGVAAWYGGSVRIVGVEPEAAPTMTLALRAGRPVDAPAGGVAADALAPRRVGELNFQIARTLVDAVVLVADAAMITAQERLWDRLRLVAEPAGAAPLAAMTSGAYVPAPGERVGLVVSGGNTDAVSLAPR